MLDQTTSPAAASGAQAIRLSGRGRLWFSRRQPAAGGGKRRQCVIPKSGNRFSEKITHNQRTSDESDSTSSNQTLAARVVRPRADRREGGRLFRRFAHRRGALDLGGAILEFGNL